MLLKPSVNIENITRLADFIESGAHPFNFDARCCFIGQAFEAGITASCNRTSLGEALGATTEQRDALCFSHTPYAVWARDNSLSRSEAVSILRELAATGRLPTETEPS